MKLIAGTLKDRESLSLVRAPLWRGPRTAEQYAERNRRLSAHPFGKKNLKTYLLKDAQGGLLSCMDMLHVQLLSGGSGAHELLEANLMCSVVTPPELQGKGYAKKMLELYFAERSEENGVLFSDVGPPLYEKHGFFAAPWYSLTQSAERFSGTSPAREALAFTEFCKAFRKFRIAKVESSPSPAVAVAVDDLFLDWQVERYRYFAELHRTRLPRDLFWHLEKGSEHALLAAIPDYQLNLVECLVLSRLNTWTFEAVAGICREWNLPRFRYWAPEPLEGAECHKEWPMFRLPTKEKSVVPDMQFADYW